MIVPTMPATAAGVVAGRRVILAAVRSFLSLLLLMASIAGVPTLALPSQAGSQMDGQIAEAVKQIGALVKAFQGQMGVAAIDLGTGATIALAK